MQLKELKNKSLNKISTIDENSSSKKKISICHSNHEIENFRE